MAAIQYLPYPLMVLDNQKTLVMANEAMGRLLDIEDHEGANADETSIVERLWGKSLSQMGIDVLQNGRPVWVIWDSFLDAIAREMDPAESEAQKEDGEAQGQGAQGTALPSAVGPVEPLRSMSRTSMAPHDTVIEVVISPGDASYWGDRDRSATALKHTYAKMIITVWGLGEERYFTLSFTNTDTHQTDAPASGRPAARPRMKRAQDSSESLPKSGPAASVLKHASIYRRASIASAITSPTSLDTSDSPFPPLGPPSQSALSTTSSSLQKLFVMKDALLDSTEVPIVAMWKDYGLTISNRAARQLFHIEANLSDVKNGLELVMQWQSWDESFTAPLEARQNPIIELIRTEQPFASRKIGLVDAMGDKHILDCAGEAIRDEITGEFLAGMVTARDITDITEKIRDMKAKDEQRFQLICDSMPQMIWTSTAEGMAEWFSGRW
jgi:PAS domain-containing protein